MKRLSCIFILIFFIGCTDNNGVDEKNTFKAALVWSKTYGGSLEENTNSIVATSDGGMLILGHTASNDGDIVKSHSFTDILLTKLDAEGNLIWTKTIGGSLNDFGMSINMRIYFCSTKVSFHL